MSIYSCIFWVTVVLSVLTYGWLKLKYHCHECTKAELENATKRHKTFWIGSNER